MDMAPGTVTALSGIEDDRAYFTFTGDLKNMLKNGTMKKVEFTITRHINVCVKILKSLLIMILLRNSMSLQTPNNILLTSCDGYDAYGWLYSKSDNPYEIGSSEHFEWDEDWEMARSGVLIEESERKEDWEEEIDKNV